MKNTGNEMFDLLQMVGINFIELSAELGNATYYYSTKEVLERYKTGITPYIFDNMDEYNDFITMLEDFLTVFKGQLTDKTKNGLADAIKKAWAIKEKYPEYFDKLVLLHVSLERDNSYIINASREFLKGKDVFIEHHCHKSGLKNILIASTQEFNGEFLGKDLNSRGNLEVSLRKYTKDERNFLINDDMIYGMADLLPQDLAYAAKDPKYVSSLIYNLNSYMELVKQNGQNLNIDAIIFMVFNNVQYLDLNKLRVLILYRMIQKSIEGIYVEKMMDFVKASKNASIDMTELDVEIFDSSYIDFENSFAPQEGTTIWFFKENSKLKKKRFVCEKEGQISQSDVLQMGREYLDRIEFRRFLYEKDRLDIKVFPRNMHLLREELEQKIRKENSNLSEIELQEIINTETKKIIHELMNMKKMNVNLAIAFNENIALELIIGGEIQCSDEEFKNFSKENIYYISARNSECFLRFLNKGIISADEISNMENITVDMISVLLKNNYIKLEDVGLLALKNRIDVTKLDIDLEKLVDEMPDILAKLYIQIAQKRKEYDEEVLKGLEESDNDEIPLSVRGQYLQLELQQLINMKNVYVNLVNSTQLISKQKIDFSENLFFGTLENTDDLYGEFLIATQEMYKDNFITIEQIRDLDTKLFLETLKSGVIQARDIRENIISPEEVEEIQKSSLSDEEKRDELEQLRYLKLEEIVGEIIRDSAIGQEEKLGIIYNIFTLNTQEEKEYRRKFEEAILGEMDGRFTYLRENANPKTRKNKIKSDIEKINSKTESSNNYVYPTYMIWQFMGMIDDNISRQTFSDGNVLFISKKLNKVIIESIWTGGENGIQRSYGTATVCMDLETFKKNESSLIVRGKKGYRINIYEAKNLLPVIETQKGPRRKGIIRHSKDLGHSGKKIWFEVLLENMGINLNDIEKGKDTRYSQEDLEVIQEFIEMARTSYERV